ncbi:MAG TPA: hypothetical protein VFS78_16115 [Vicinamibacteria bacterium]|nr:hypothetical protein [Vicinamibacteria bacterium]
MRRLLALALLVAPLVLSAAPVTAQCAMCQTALTGSAEGRGMSQEFNRAILVMLCAPYAVFGVVGTVLLRQRIGASLRRERGRLRRTWRRVARPRVH